MKKYVIAIDGPAASGKSTTAKLLAQKMKYFYVDTGAMYRACGLCALENNIQIDDINGLNKMLENISIKIEYSKNGNRIILNGKNVSERIRKTDITKLSSEIAKMEEIREKMVYLQRKMGENGGIVMDGRDIGTVVFPNADFKFFMVADVDTRASRRHLEKILKGENSDFTNVKKNLILRDKNDSFRKISPLKKAKDAIPIDTSEMTIEEQVEFILRKIKEKERK